MARNLCALALLAGTVCVAFADDKDPIKEKLIAAKEAYNAELQHYRKDIGEWFDKREEAARKDGNKKLVDQLKAERGAFEESGELPKTMPASMRQRPAVAKKSLEAAHELAVKEYTKIKKDAEAAAVEEAWAAFAKENGEELPGYSNRSGAMKARLLKEGGGNAESEKAVALGLAWLARQQKADGSWVFDQGSKEEVTCATALALLPFLAAGETHKDARGKYTEVVKKGLGYLMKNCPLNGASAGKMSNNLYAQGIATIPLCEAYGMTKDPALKPYAQTAINYIQKAQGPNGSWGYSPGTNGDTSIVGWQIQALQAAKLSKDLVVNDKVYQKAVKFLDLTGSGAKKSMYGYADSAGAAPGTALTAVGLLCRSKIDAWGPNHPGMIDGVAGLVKNSPKGVGVVSNMYYYYYATQVIHNYEGEDWKNWNEGPKQDDGSRKGGMRDWLVTAQNKKDGANLGSWDPEAGWFGTSCGRLGSTAVCLLNLEVYYRYGPLEKKDDKKDPPKK